MPSEVSLVDLFAPIPLRVGLGLGTGMIAFASQGIGGDTTTTPDRAITQALGIGFLTGLPLIVGGLTVVTAHIAFPGGAPVSV